MLDYEYIAKRLPNCVEQKQQALEVFQKIIYYAIQTRKQGLLCLEEFAYNETDIFLKNCLIRAVEGWEESDLRDYMEIYIITKNARDDYFLKMVVIADGILKILQAQAPINLILKLSAWFGDDFQDYFNQEIEKIQIKNIEIAKQNRKEIKVSLYPYFDKLSDISIIIIQEILSEVDFHTLAIALKGASWKIFQLLMQNLSEGDRLDIEEKMKYLYNLRSCDIEKAQTEILEISEKLKK